MISIHDAGGFDFTQEIRVRASPQVTWNSLTDAEIVKQYHLAPLHRLQLKKGGEIIYGGENEVMISGKVLDFEKDVRLVHSFRFGPKRRPKNGDDPDTVVAYDIRREGKKTVLRVTHTGFSSENQSYKNIIAGWPFILARLKVLLDDDGRPDPPKPPLN